MIQPSGVGTESLSIGPGHVRRSRGRGSIREHHAAGEPQEDIEAGSPKLRPRSVRSGITPPISYHITFWEVLISDLGLSRSEMSPYSSSVCHSRKGSNASNTLGSPNVPWKHL